MNDLERREQVLKETEKKLARLSVNMRRLYPNAVDKISDVLNDNQPTIYAITPTYARPVQKAELVRLSQTFLHLNNFRWIVVEDSEHKTHLVANFLQNSGLNYTHLSIATPKPYKLGKDDPSWLKPRGVEQRNVGLDWIIENTGAEDTGVVYFADDDNTYSLKLFEEVS